MGKSKFKFGKLYLDILKHRNPRLAYSINLLHSMDSVPFSLAMKISCVRYPSLYPFFWIRGTSITSSILHPRIKCNICDYPLYFSTLEKPLLDFLELDKLVYIHGTWHKIEQSGLIVPESAKKELTQSWVNQKQNKKQKLK